MPEEKSTQKKELTGFVVVEFTQDWGSKKKGDTETYHKSTAEALVKKGKCCKIVKEIEKYVPKEAAK